MRIGGRELREWSDDELRAEAHRRRLKRSGKSPEVPAHVARHFAALELPVTSTLEEVERAYHDLIVKYDPEKRRGDDAKYDAALELSRSLSRSYRKAKEWLEQGA